MTLLAAAILTHPGAAPAALAAVARGVGAARGGPLAADLLAHPATPPEALDMLDQAEPDLARALHSPVLTPTTLERILRAADLEHLLDYLTDSFDAPGDVHAHALAKLDARTTPTAATYRRYKALLEHPTTPPAVHLAALRRLLPTAGTTGPATPVRVPALITHATRHPGHLRELAASIPLPTDAARTRRYADLADTGTDPHTQRVGDLAEQARALSTDRAWADAIHDSIDATLALEALHATSSGPPVLAAITSEPALRPTAAGHHAALHKHSPVPLHTLDPARTYTAMDTYLQLAADPRAPTGRFQSSQYRPGVNPDAVRRTLTETTAHRRSLVLHAARLAAHPDTPAEHRAELIAALRATHATPTAGRAECDLIATLAAASDPTAALLDHATATARQSAQWDPMIRDVLAHHLRPALDPHASDDATMLAMLTLEPTFAGTLRDLLATAAAIGQR